MEWKKNIPTAFGSSLLPRSLLPRSLPPVCVSVQPTICLAAPVFLPLGVSTSIFCESVANWLYLWPESPLRQALAIEIEGLDENPLSRRPYCVL